MNNTTNKETLTNKAKAMNQVNKAILLTAEKCQDVFTDKGAEVYKNDGELTKKIKDLLNDILKDQRGILHSVYIDDSFNSVAIAYTQMYKTGAVNGYSSTSYYKETIFIICKHQDSNTERAKVNVKTNLSGERFNKKYSYKSLLASANKANKIREKIQTLKSELSTLTYFLND